MNYRKMTLRKQLGKALKMSETVEKKIEQCYMLIRLDSEKKNKKRGQSRSAEKTRIGQRRKGKKHY